MVEIAKALSFRSRVLIMDEPTAALNDAEIADLFAIISRAQGRGRRHRLHLAQDGRAEAHRRPRDGDARRRICRHGAGRRHADRHDHLDDGGPHAQPTSARVPDHADAPSRARGHAASTAAREIRDVSFSLRKGEILGFAGLMGAGRTEVARAIFGADPHRARRDLRARQEGRHPRARRTRCAPASATSREDRKHFGLATGMDVRNNIALASMSTLHRRRAASSTTARMRDAAARYIGQLADQDAVGRPGSAAAFGRQPAEGRHRQMAAARLRRPDLRRADARHRRRREERNLQAAQRRSRRRARRSSSSPPSCPRSCASATASR